MGTAEKLNYLLETKNAIKTALINKGAAVNDETPFRDYAGAVDGISASGSGLTVDELLISGYSSYRFAYNMWNWYVNNHGEKVQTDSLTDVEYMFYKSDALERIPFVLNFHAETKSYRDMFEGCSSLKEVPRMHGAKMKDMYRMFNGCQSLRHFPADFESWFDDWSEMRDNPYGGENGSLFAGCYSLRSLPVGFLKNCGKAAKYSGTYFYNGFGGCNSLDELNDLPIPYTSEFIYNTFYNTFVQCYRLKNLTFETDNGMPIKVNWKNQIIDLSRYVGHAANTGDITNYNSGITADKEVKDSATYQALKNDPDWFTCKGDYGRYNHISAVNTINSLPDASEYLATAGGQNTIKFGKSGYYTDGGSVSKLTEEEIAVAAAKGWTVAYG